MYEFDVIVNALKAGSKARRDSWPPHIYVKEIEFNGFEPVLVEYQFQADGSTAKFPGEVLTWNDIRADDWVILES
jgi:hypothetical protein